LAEELMQTGGGESQKCSTMESHRESSVRLSAFHS
jgi:hypothetical protein